MAVYIYETTDPRKPVQRFELAQSMRDDPYTHHPESGVPIKRVITGGFYMARGHAPTHADMRDSAGHPVSDH
jgi:predicted nucleic acid-binding Zn ribbon protein